MCVFMISMQGRAEHHRIVVACRWMTSERSRRVPNQWPIHPERAAGIMFERPTFFHRSTILTTKSTASSERGGAPALGKRTPSTPADTHNACCVWTISAPLM